MRMMLMILIVLLFPHSLWAKKHIVKYPQSIQATIKLAKSGDMIEILPGIYKEALVVETPHLSIVGKIVDGQWPILEGENTLNDGVIASGSHFTLENLHIRHYKGNGVMTQGADHVILRNLIIERTGIYGIYPTRGSHILVEKTINWGIADAAIYIGMCHYVDVRHNEAFDSVTGIEIENSTHVIVEKNTTYNNSGGILVFALPGLPLKKAEQVIVRDNRIVDNNHENFGAEGSVVAGVPPGSGIIILAADKVRIENNIIGNNSTAGIILSDLNTMGDALAPDPEVEPNPDDVSILNNNFYNNGEAPQGKAKWLMLLKYFSFDGADIVSTGTGKGNCYAKESRPSKLGADKLVVCPTNQSTYSIKTEYGKSPTVQKRKKFRSLGETIFQNVCSACHAFGTRRTGPPIEAIQKKYRDDFKAMADYAINPKKVRSDYPPMPSQKHLSREKLEAVAKYMLKVTQ